MRRKLLGTRESFVLYGVLLGFSFFSFMLGVLVGNTYFGRDQTASANVASSPETRAQDPVAQDQEFFEQLANRPNSPIETSPAPPITEEAEPVTEEPDVESEEVVSVEKPTPTVSAEPAPAEIFNSPPNQGDSSLSAGGEYFTVQVAAVKVRADGEAVLSKLERLGYQGEIVEAADYLRVWVGNFSSRSTALELELNLKDDGFPTYVRRVRSGN